MQEWNLAYKVAHGMATTQVEANNTLPLEFMEDDDDE